MDMVICRSSNEAHDTIQTPLGLPLAPSMPLHFQDCWDFLGGGVVSGCSLDVQQYVGVGFFHLMFCEF